MFWHDLGLAWHSLRRTPLLSGLMAATLAVGMAAAMIAVTLYHARAGHPIPWKDDTLYAVALDLRDASLPPQFLGRHPEYPPFQLTYRDAKALYASAIPRHAVMMYRASRLLTPSAPAVRPYPVTARVTTADFFATFDVPFLYGTGWTRRDDASPAAVVVLSKFLNQKLFGGANSVGREVVLEGIPYRVIGVLAAWLPQPRYYDLNSSGFDPPEDVYLPFGWMQTARISTGGNLNCMNPKALSGSGGDALQRLLTSDCVWLQYWVELRGRADLGRFQSFVDSYTDEERRHGRFPRRNNNRIVNVPTWLGMWDVIGDLSRAQLVLGVVFLGICILNTVGLVLAKFLGGAATCGLRRALGARRIDIIRQHVIEVALLGVCGGMLGVALTLGGLSVLWRLLYADAVTSSDNPDQITLTQQLMHMDLTVFVWAIGLSLLAGVLAGLYPAYRIGRLEPASFLKAQ